MLTALYIALMILPLGVVDNAPVNKASEAAFVASGMKENVKRMEKWAQKKLHTATKDIKPAVAAIAWLGHTVIEKRAVITGSVPPFGDALTISVSENHITMEMTWAL